MELLIENVVVENSVVCENHHQSHAFTWSHNNVKNKFSIREINDCQLNDNVFSNSTTPTKLELSQLFRPKFNTTAIMNKFFSIQELDTPIPINPDLIRKLLK